MWFHFSFEGLFPFKEIGTLKRQTILLLDRESPTVILFKFILPVLGMCDLVLVNRIPCNLGRS